MTMACRLHLPILLQHQQGDAGIFGDKPSPEGGSEKMLESVLKTCMPSMQASIAPPNPIDTKPTKTLETCFIDAK